MDSVKREEESSRNGGWIMGNPVIELLEARKAGRSISPAPLSEEIVDELIEALPVSGKRGGASQGRGVARVGKPCVGESRAAPGHRV